MSMQHKIFNIGFNKAGSTSLTKAMEILGFKSVHYRGENERVMDIMKKNRESGKQLLYGLENYEFFSDFSGRNFYKELDQQYPESKFILTVRDLESWITSREKHVKRNQENPDYKYDWLTIDKEAWKEEKEKTIAELKEYFKDRQNDFLIINIIAGEGWEKLCKFLSRPIPDIAFPYLNKSTT